MRFFRFFAAAIYLVLACLPLAKGGEGMWLPMLLKELNEGEMQAMGMKMSAEDIYSVNQGSLKDAIVSFGGTCTGEVISSQGLVLTNHHCGFGQIQNHSTVEQNFLQDGFWAMKKSDELANPGLFVTFLVRMEDVTEMALTGVTDDMVPRDRQSAIDKNLNQIRQSTVREPYQEVSIRPFYRGNQYYLFVTQTYRDVRLVGAPPSSIGKFGEDTDNWVWPRHTGDFSLFRIYAGKDGLPAEYSENNVPLQSEHHLPISLDGVSEGDFTLVFGYPGRTDEYLSASAMSQRVEVLNPIRIKIRDKSLAILGEAMRKDPLARLQYASKQRRIANSWKKWIGEDLGVKTVGAINKRKEMEAEFKKRLAANPEWQGKYGKLLPKLDALYKELEPLAVSRDYISEISSRNIELLQLVNTLRGFQSAYKRSGIEAIERRKDRLVAYLEDFYKDYRPEPDKQIFAELMAIYYHEVNPAHVSRFVVDQFTFTGKDFDAFANAVYEKSMLTKGDLVLSAVNDNLEKFMTGLEGDFAYQIGADMMAVAERDVFQPASKIEEEIQWLEQQYMQALLVVFPERRFYPDANSTLRVTYGKVEGYQPNDTLKYGYQTYLDGVAAKYIPGDYEFDVPARLLELEKKKDFGPYGQDGKMPVCFIGSNHTSGGNSGSPAIDAYGNLIGLNFDRAWEGTMSDINYDPSICRNIMVDIRYVLFVVDKFAGAGHLVEEMTLVHPKKK